MRKIKYINNRHLLTFSKFPLKEMLETMINTNSTLME